jgi:putative ABC transport system permease protein
VGLLFRYNVRNLFVRRTSTLTTLLGIGLAVAVFIVLMALAKGIRSVSETTGDPMQAIVLQKGSNSETTSDIPDLLADHFENLPNVPKDERGPVVARDLFIVLNLPRPDGKSMANVTVRGVTDRSFDLRPEVKVDGGRRPKGSEIIVGRPLVERFANFRVGDHVHFGRRDWTVVGHFDAGGAAWESEVWVDERDLAADFNRGTQCSSIGLKLSRPEDLKAYEDAIAASHDLEGLKAMTMQQYYKGQTQSADFLGFIGGFITVLLAFGAGLGAMNTMYASVGRRAREIGTLRALGFGRVTILACFVFESALLGAMGGAFGCLIALPVNGLSSGTLNWTSFSETTFKFRVTFPMIVAGIVIGGVVGAIGGFLPALAAARRPILASLRAT